VPFETFWNAALNDGVLRREAKPRPARLPNAAAITGHRAASAGVAGATSEMELVLAPAAGVYDGRYANNGWLIELPDPVTKATWSSPFFFP